jgi:hypothetical protein
MGDIMRAWSGLSITALLFGGCASLIFSFPIPSLAQTAVNNPNRQDFLGQPRWIAGTALGIKVCEDPSGPLDTKCEYVNNGKFSADGIENEKIKGGAGTYILRSSYFYHVIFANGRSGYITDFDLNYNTTRKDPAEAAAACKRRGNPQIGMTADQVKGTCWGKPEHVNRTETASVIHDQYVYSGSRYIYLRNGVVESVQTSGRLR